MKCKSQCKVSKTAAVCGQYRAQQLQSLPGELGRLCLRNELRIGFVLVVGKGCEALQDELTLTVSSSRKWTLSNTVVAATVRRGFQIRESNRRNIFRAILTVCNTLLISFSMKTKNE